MDKVIIETCKTCIKILDHLRAEGKITTKQYDQHVKLKLEFLEIHSKSSTYKTTA